MAVLVLGKRRALGFAACAVASCFWGCGFFFGKIALEEMSFAHIVLYRFLFAMPVLLPLLMTHRPGLNRREWGLLLAASFFGVPLQFLIQFYALSITTVSHAALMVGTMPVILAVGAAVFAHERMDRVGWMALAGSTCGAGLIALGGGSHSGNTHSKGGATLAGDLLVVVSLLIALSWVLINKQLMERHSHVVVTAYGLAIGTLMLVIWVPVRYGMPPVAGVQVKAWLALAGSGVLCTATTTLLWNWGLTQVPASQAGVLLNMEPLIGSLLGVFVLGERLGPSAWIGGGLILASAVTLTTRSKTRVREQLPLT
ncbi:MAG TPA: EamA family transporter [Edaphobacter sp.]|nr:EamA family transporter [Edaphobacter sp.]